jgi:hypothetical protein
MKGFSFCIGLCGLLASGALAFSIESVRPHNSSECRKFVFIICYNTEVGRPVNYGMLLYPNPTMLDVFGPLQFLNDVSWTYPINLAMIASDMQPITTQALQAFVDMGVTVSSFYP